LIHIRNKQVRRKGDHRHCEGKESNYAFTDTDKLIAAFQADIARWNRENSDA